MARIICTRCGQASFSTEEHLCADIARRLARRERQVQAILPVITGAMHPEVAAEPRFYAEAIVAILAGLGITDD